MEPHNQNNSIHFVQKDRFTKLPCVIDYLNRACCMGFFILTNKSNKFDIKNQLLKRYLFMCLYVSLLMARLLWRISGFYFS